MVGNIGKKIKNPRKENLRKEKTQHHQDLQREDPQAENLQEDIEDIEDIEVPGRWVGAIIRGWITWMKMSYNKIIKRNWYYHFIM